MRSSTLLRVSRLDRLLAVLSVRALPQVEIACLLRCSTSAARNYVLELLDAGVVETVPHGEVNGRRYKSLYRLHPDQGRLAAFLAALRQAAAWPGRPRGMDAGPARMEFGHCPLTQDDAAIRRDPLVSALFGDIQAGGFAGQGGAPS